VAPIGTAEAVPFPVVLKANIKVKIFTLSRLSLRKSRDKDGATRAITLA
jgi:hypothetical protein